MAVCWPKKCKRKTTSFSGWHWGSLKAESEVVNTYLEICKFAENLEDALAKAQKTHKFTICKDIFAYLQTDKHAAEDDFSNQTQSMR